MMKMKWVIVILLLSIVMVMKVGIIKAQDVDVDPVVDIHGNPLRSGVNYYVLPFIPPRARSNVGGGLTLIPTINKTMSSSSSSSSSSCAVGQHQLLHNQGLPLTFIPASTSPANHRPIILRVSTDYNIKFLVVKSSSSTKCPSSKVWKLDSYDNIEPRGIYVVNIGGIEGNPGPQTISNWFKLQKYYDNINYVYKLVFCPTVCNFCKVICKDVGIFAANTPRRLALSLNDTDSRIQPFPIFFKPVPT